MNLNKAHEGYDYQDLLTSYFVLKEILLAKYAIEFSIDKKNTPQGIPDSFDDLVIENNNHIQRKQIKYSNTEVNKRLLKSDLANNSNYKLALFELYETWKELNDENSEFRLCLAWGEPIDDDIKNILKPRSSNLSSFDDYPTKIYSVNIDILWPEFSEPLSTWIKLRQFVTSNKVDRDDFKQFCESLIIELELPKASLNFSKPGALENILFKQAEKLGIGQYPNDGIQVRDFLERLAKQVGSYRTKSAVVTSSQILFDLRVKTDFGKIEQKFEIDQSKNINFCNQYTLFKKEIIENRKTLLIGEPGSGKSWFLTNFIEHQKKESQKVIRHYCFTSTEDVNIEKRVSADVFFGNLIADILKKFPQLKESKENLYASSLSELNLLLANVDENLIVVIDGLDHIDRVLKQSSTLSESKTKIIEYISQVEISANVAIILGSQPVEEIKSLINDFEYIEYQLPKWNISSTLELMNKYSLEDSVIEGKELSKLLYKKSEGNPLYLTFIIKTLIDQKITQETIDDLPEYDYNLEKYYKYLTSKLNCCITSEILSCLEFSVTKDELKEISPLSHHLERDLTIISPVLNENLSRGGIRLYHDSFRRYNIEQLKSVNGLENIYSLIACWLKKEGFYKSYKAYRYLLHYYIKLAEYEEAKEYATSNFLTQSLYHGYPVNAIKINYDNFLYIAKETQDWELFTYLSELNRAISSTLSNEYRDIFEEYFEDYFEAILLLYGAEKANQILFFEDQNNFSKEITIKSFYICQINGYAPNWEKVEHYFDDVISLDMYKYYVAYLASTESLEEYINEDEKFLIENPDFLQVLVEEVYRFKGFEKVQSLHSLFSKEHKKITGKLINKALNGTSCKQKTPVKHKSEQDYLAPLNLDFIDKADVLESLDKPENGYYEEYLDYKLKKSVYYSKLGKKEKAEKSLKQAMRLVTSYTFRKDTTLDEIQNPLLSINRIDNEFALAYTKKLLPMNISIQKHTEDGKGIRWLYIEWFQNFLKIDPRKATIFLITRFLEGSYFWKYEFMISAFLSKSKNINLVILNYLYRLLPTFTRDDEVASNYISSFADVIHRTIDIDKKIAKESLINILERDLNGSDQPSKKSFEKLNFLRAKLNISRPIEKFQHYKATSIDTKKENLKQSLEKWLGIADSLKEKSIAGLTAYFDRQDRYLDDKDLLFLLQYFNEKKDERIVRAVLEPIIEKKFVASKEYYEKLRGLIGHIKCTDTLRIYLLTKVFVFSQGGFYESFVNIKALKDALEIDEGLALEYLSKELFEKFKIISYYSQSTANLIIAFEYAGLNKEHILAMYKKAFDFIDYRLPDDNSFDWRNIKNDNLNAMSDDEIAIVMLLARCNNKDAVVQKEIISALNYLLKHEESLLIRPMQWFLTNLNYFPQLSIASILELFLIYAEKNKKLFQTLKNDIQKASDLKNLYIANAASNLLEVVG